MLIAILLAVVMMGTPSSESMHKLKYDLPTGKSFTYRVTTDQFPFPRRGVRLHTKMSLDVVGRDEYGNAICQFRMTADTDYSTDDNISYRPYGAIDFAGHRLYSRAGYVELLLDAHGNIASDEADSTNSKSDHAISTQFKTIASSSVMAALSGNSPYVLQLLMPSLPDAESLEIEKDYLDTVLLPSRARHMPTSYGTSATVENVVLYDTLIRTSVLDSVLVQGPLSHGYMTLRNDRHNALGGVYISTARLVRDMQTGLVQRISEKCYKITSAGRQLSYRSTAELVSTSDIVNTKQDATPSAGIR